MFNNAPQSPFGSATLSNSTSPFGSPTLSNMSLFGGPSTHPHSTSSPFGFGHSHQEPSLEPPRVNPTNSPWYLGNSVSFSSSSFGPTQSSGFVGLNLAAQPMIQSREATEKALLNSWCSGVKEAIDKAVKDGRTEARWQLPPGLLPRGGPAADRGRHLLMEILRKNNYPTKVEEDGFLTIQLLLV